MANKVLSILYNPLQSKNIWEYTAKFNAINYITHLHIWETSAHLFQYTAIYTLTIYGYS